jgi:hypothetical protein
MHNATATKKNSLPNYCCSQKEEGKQGGTWGITQKKTAHTQNSSAHVIKQQKSTPHFVELFQCQIFFPSFLLDGMTSAPVGGLY